MHVAIGSKNPVKIRAVEEVFFPLEAKVISYPAQSGVRDQPLSQEETKKGAIHRAQDCVQNLQVEYGIGLEGGVFLEEGKLYLCNWGALADTQGQVFTVNGPSFLLPIEFAEELFLGCELNILMHAKMGIQDLGAKEGAIGYYTKGEVTRCQVFTQMVHILWGQYQYFNGAFCSLSQQSSSI